MNKIESKIKHNHNKYHSVVDYTIVIILISISIILPGCSIDSADRTSDINTQSNDNSDVSNTASQNVGNNNIELSGKILIDHTMTDVNKIPSCWIEKAKSDLKIAYAHTSHGSQIISGMEAVQKYDKLYSWNNVGSSGALHLEDYNGGYNGAADLSAGETAWYSATKKFLDDKNNQEINVIVWSWCSIAGHDIEKNYIANMKKLIEEYGKGSKAHPTPVMFVLMTGHAEGSGENDASDSRNKLIREFCSELENCILFDFADIENYDPNGVYYLDKRITDNLDYDCKSPYNSGERDCNWAAEYLKNQPKSSNAQISSNVGGCAHSQSLTCALKGQAAWYMWTRIAGWDGKEKTCR